MGHVSRPIKLTCRDGRFVKVEFMRSSLFLVTLAVASGLTLAACSSSDSKANSSSTGGNGNAGAAAVGGAGGNSGANTSGGSTTSGNTMITSKADEVGRFSVNLYEAVTTNGTTTPAYTYINGVTRDGVVPLAFITTQVVKESDCALYSISVPSCAGVTDGCGTGACVATDTCKAMPTAKDLGAVKISGVGTTELTLVNISNKYQYGGDITYPGFAEGDVITLSAAGGAYAAFAVSAKGVKPLTLSTDTYKLTKASPLSLTWTAPGSLSETRILVVLNLSHHGGAVGYVTCDVADTGSLTISANIISRLIDLGVTGYPTLTVTRTSVGWATIAPGSVAFDVSSAIVRTIAVDGFISCSSNAECTSGNCNTDLKLCE
jgi:hypothetical protein